MIGLSGYYSKDSIIAQALSFWWANPRLGGLFFYAALAGAGMTAFYMFRLWYMTFAGKPRDEHVYHHAHESPEVDDRAAGDPGRAGGGRRPGTCRGRNLGLEPLLEQARPAGIAEGIAGGCVLAGRDDAGRAPRARARDRTSRPSGRPSPWRWPASCWPRRSTACGSSIPTDARRTFAPHLPVPAAQVVVRRVVRLAVRPAGAADLRLGGRAGPARASTGWPTARPGRSRPLPGWTIGSTALFVDGLVNLTARWTYALGLRLRTVQTGNIRQYVMLIAVGTVALFVLMSLYWNYAIAGSDESRD